MKLCKITGSDVQVLLKKYESYRPDGDNAIKAQQHNFRKATPLT